ncbi:hypothetical protein ACT5YR_02470 [Fructobacillus fructosus]
MTESTEILSKCFGGLEKHGQTKSNQRHHHLMQENQSKSASYRHSI